MVVAVIIILTMRFSPQGVWGLAKRFYSRPKESVEYPLEGNLVSNSVSQEAVQDPERVNPPPPISKT
jgi:hypothetical protein